MPCYHPLTAFTSKGTKSNGKKAIFFNPSGNIDIPITLPCGKCIGCKLEHSRQWAMRITHEASLYENNCFITLTYDDEHVPPDYGLRKDHFQKFMKRYRKSIEPLKIRFYHCGEYGEENLRPHYHACIFNHNFDDRIHHTTTNDVPLYTSERLNKLWGKGFTTIGDVTFDSAAYCARYVTKKITICDESDPNLFEHYNRVDSETGEYTIVSPEYSTMSRRPGIARQWFKKYHADMYPWDEVIIKNNPVKPPKYYDKLFEELDPVAYKTLKQTRLDAVDFSEQSDKRLATRKNVKLAQLQQLKRDL
jgi:hypothetical protein